MYYLQSRYYDPAVGRFINEDKPLGLCSYKITDFIALYTYCDNNPVKYSDSLGFATITGLSLRQYRHIHNMVANEVARKIEGGLREVYVKGVYPYKGRRGFLDVYDPAAHTYYEVKSQHASTTLATAIQLDRYDHSYVARMPGRGLVNRGTRVFGGGFNYGNMYITYQTSIPHCLITYSNVSAREIVLQALGAALVVLSIVLLVGLVIGTAGAAAPAGAGALALLAI